MVVINGFAVTATVIVTGGPVYVAPDADDAGADDAGATEADVEAAPDAALGAGADDVAVVAGLEDVLVAVCLLLPHPARTIEPTDSKATSDTMPPRRR